MDAATWIPLILAIVAIVPGVWALVNQANKDRTQSKIDMSTAAQNAAVSIIAPLQGEVTRLQIRVTELEQALIDKTTVIGKLMQDGIDKDTSIRQLKYNLEGLQMKLDTLKLENENEEEIANIKRRKKNDHITSASVAKVEEAIQAGEAQKEEVKIAIDKDIQKIAEESLASKTIHEQVNGLITRENGKTTGS